MYPAVYWGRFVGQLYPFFYYNYGTIQFLGRWCTYKRIQYGVFILIYRIWPLPQSTLFCEKESLVSNHLAACMNSATPSPRHRGIIHSPPPGLVLERESSLHAWCIKYNITHLAVLYRSAQKQKCAVEASAGESIRIINNNWLIIIIIIKYNNNTRAQQKEEEEEEGKKKKI